MVRPSVFDYNDYREFLKHAMSAEKEKNRAFSHRYVCGLLGLNTSNFILLVMQGKRNITAELAQRIPPLFGMENNEAEYFCWMVLFNQATTSLEKDKFWTSMLSCRSKSRTARIDESQYEYYSHWYNPVIRELVAIPGTEWTTVELSRTLYPKVPAVQVRRSLELLESLGMIVRNDDGSWTKTSASVDTPPQVQSVAVFNYHKELLGLAKESLDKDSHEVRNFSSVTLDINAKEYAKLVSMLTAFRKESLGVCGSSGEAPDRVYQMNFQLFPVSRPLDSASKNLGNKEDA